MLSRQINSFQGRKPLAQLVPLLSFCVLIFLTPCISFFFFRSTDSKSVRIPSPIFQIFVNSFLLSSKEPLYLNQISHIYLVRFSCILEQQEFAQLCPALEQTPHLFNHLSGLLLLKFFSFLAAVISQSWLHIRIIWRTFENIDP